MDRRKEGGGRSLLHPAWAAKLVSEQQLDSGDARHTHCRLALFAFVGCRKSDLHPCSQPTSHPSLPPRMAGATRTVAPKQVSLIL